MCFLFRVIFLPFSRSSRHGLGNTLFHFQISCHSGCQLARNRWRSTLKLEESVTKGPLGGTWWGDPKEVVIVGLCSHTQAWRVEDTRTQTQRECRESPWVRGVARLLWWSQSPTSVPHPKRWPVPKGSWRALQADFAVVHCSQPCRAQRKTGKRVEQAWWANERVPVLTVRRNVASYGK